MISTLLPTHSVQAAAPNPVATCVGSNCSITFPYNADYYAWTVPIGTTSFTFTVTGASGGKGCWNGFSRGGYGAVVTGTQAVSSGDVLYIAVGKAGTDAYVGGVGSCLSSGTPAASGAAGTNAFNSNGGATAEQHSTAKGGGGGAASEIRLNGIATANRLIVAGGGGGAGGNNGTNLNRGGDASGNTGEAGMGNGTIGANYSGKGATITAGGAAGSSGATAGQSLVGGSAYGGGGGGGGGYFGGGGGWYDGAGAGSSWVSSATGTSYSSTSSYQSGSVVINYVYTPPQATTTSISVQGNATQLFKGNSINLTITTTPTPGNLTVTANGKRIGNCIGRPTSGTFTCSYKPAVSGTLQIAATFTPISQGYTKSSSAVLNLTVARRINNR